MPTYQGIRYLTKPDLLAGGIRFHYELNPPGHASFEVIISTDEQNLSGRRLPSNTPESRAFFLFPAFRRRLELFIDGLDLALLRQRRQNLILDVDVKRLRQLLAHARLAPLDKIRTFVFIANQNVFADSDVPLSIRMVSSETGLAPELVRRQIAGDRSGELELVQNDFIQVRRPMDL
jgi:hypothetical protein